MNSNKIFLDSSSLKWIITIIFMSTTGPSHQHMIIKTTGKPYSGQSPTQRALRMSTAFGTCVCVDVVINKQATLSKLRVIILTILM